MAGRGIEEPTNVVSRARRRLITAPQSSRGRDLALSGLLLLTALIVILNVTIGTSNVPATTLVVPLVLGGLLLPPRRLVLAMVVVFGAVLSEFLGVGNNSVHSGVFIVFVIVGVIALLLARDRERLGLAVGDGERMLVELRDRLAVNSRPPALPPTWHSDVELQSAGGAAFGGDFIVSTLSPDEMVLELAVVDVSGKGIDAATRALMLSGALGGLLGALPPDEFLPAANRFLLRQGWGEGFATAQHLRIDLSSGRYRLTNAGHPPAVHYRGGAGRWQLVEPQGTVLGILPDAEFAAADGELARSDALLLYTDGVVEVPGRDLAVGLDRLLGAAEQLIPRGFDGGARRLIEDVVPEAADDRTVLLIWRS